MTAATRTGLGELAGTFLRLGLTAFGGPAAHIGLMRDAFVRRRGWLDDATFLDLVGLSNLIPGPTSTELAMHIGHRRAGWAGFLVAGVGFIAPAVVIVLVLAWAYVSFGARPEATAVLAGIAPVVIAIIAHAAIVLGRTALRTRLLMAVAAAVVIGSLLGASEIALLLGGGAFTLALAETRARSTGPGPAGAIAIGSFGPGRTAALAGGIAAAVGPLAVVLEFLKLGAVVFGSGYVLVAVLRSELVVDLRWISDAQLLDAVAIGQLTPGPVFSTATFIGYLVGGWLGAVAATIGIFLPAFAFVAVSVKLLDRLRASRRARAFLNGVNAAAVGLIAVVAAGLLATVREDLPSLAIAAVALAILAGERIGAAWLIAGGALIGLVRLLLGVP
jgi:chromate transporter